MTIEDVEPVLFRASATTSEARTAAKRAPGIFLIARKLWSAVRGLKDLNELLNSVDWRNSNGMQVQHLEKSLTELIRITDELLQTGRNHGIHNRKLTGGQFYSIANENEKLKDCWVTLSSSTDAELDEKLGSTKNEETVSFDSLFR